MRVLVACEYSQIVTKAFRDRGHNAYSCDILPTEGNPDWHFQCNVFCPDILEFKWDLVIAHPPCTYLANSGVRWLYEQEGRWDKMKEGADFFKRLYDAFPVIAVENPIPHKHTGLPKYDQIVQPWQFGDNESKAVCLWLKGLPQLIPQITTKPEKLDQRVWRMPPGPERQKERSRFFKGIAEAMADQWG